MKALPAESQLVIAECIARTAHAGQTEQSTGDDYIRHVERVVGMVHSDDAKTVAWLHDVIEDSPTTEEDLLLCGIAPEIVAAVRWLTRNTLNDYQTYIEMLLVRGDPLALEVKIADLRDHLRPNCPVRLRPRYLKAWRTLTWKSWDGPDS